MAVTYEIETFSQNSIYNRIKSYKENSRKLKVYFSIPEKGVNKDTGLL